MVIRMLCTPFLVCYKLFLIAATCITMLTSLPRPPGPSVCHMSKKAKLWCILFGTSSTIAGKPCDSAVYKSRPTRHWQAGSWTPPSVTVCFVYICMTVVDLDPYATSEISDGHNFRLHNCNHVGPFKLNGKLDISAEYCPRPVPCHYMSFQYLMDLNFVHVASWQSLSLSTERHQR